VEHLNSLSTTLEAEEDYFAQEVQQWFERIVTKDNHDYSLDRTLFATLHPALQRRLIKLVLGYLSAYGVLPTYDQVEKIRQCALQDRTPSLQISLAGRLAFTKEYDRLRFTIQDHADSPPVVCEIKELPFRMNVPGMDMIIVFEKVEGKPHLVDIQSVDQQCEAWFDLDQVVWPLHVRPRKPGDRIRLQGVKGSKKLKDVMIDAKVAPSRRDRLPVITDQSGKILWIPTLRRSGVAEVSGQTMYCLHIHTVPFI